MLRRQLTDHPVAALTIMRCVADWKLELGEQRYLTVENVQRHCELPRPPDVTLALVFRCGS